MTTTQRASTTSTNTGFRVRCCTCWMSVQKAPGILATMPAKMIIEMPLPTPRRVIWSPSHMRNIVPVVMVSIAIRAKGILPIVMASGIAVGVHRHGVGLDEGDHARCRSGSSG